MMDKTLIRLYWAAMLAVNGHEQERYQLTPGAYRQLREAMDNAKAEYPDVDTVEALILIGGVDWDKRKPESAE